MSFALVYDFSGVDRLAERVARLGRADRHALLDSVGALVESQTKRRIESEKESPEGEAWPKWSDKYAAKRKGQHSLLMAQGHLKDSQTHNVSGDTVEIGSNLIYAAVHQFGYEERGIPARPYLGLSAENAEDIEDIVDRFLERALN